MNVFHRFPASPHVVLTTCGDPHSVGGPGRRSLGFRLREGGWVIVGVLAGALLCDAVVAPALASVTVRPVGLGSLAVFAMLLSSVRGRSGIQPVSARLSSAILFAPGFRPATQHRS